MQRNLKSNVFWAVVLAAAFLLLVAAEMYGQEHRLPPQAVVWRLR